MKIKKILFTILSIIVFISNCIPVHAFNTFNDYVLIGGIYDRTYYIVVSGYYETVFKNAFSDWNATYPSTDFKFKETYSPSTATIRCNTYKNKYDGLNGYCELNVSGAGFVSNINKEPNDDWTAARIYINEEALSNTAADFDKGVAAHEIGHAIGLAHNNIKTVLMCPASLGRTATEPTDDDIDGVIYLYN